MHPTKAGWISVWLCLLFLLPAPELSAQKIDEITTVAVSGTDPRSAVMDEPLPASPVPDRLRSGELGVNPLQGPPVDLTGYTARLSALPEAPRLQLQTRLAGSMPVRVDIANGANRILRRERIDLHNFAGDIDLQQFSPGIYTLYIRTMEDRILQSWQLTKTN